MMQEPIRKQLKSLLASANAELKKDVTKHSVLLSRLEILERSIDTGELSHDLLVSTRDEFPANLRPMRAGTPAGEGLKETRKLWDELNHLVKSQQAGTP